MTEPRTREGSALSSVDDLLRRERGMALVAILLVMLVLSMLAVVFLQSINIETNVSDYSLRKSKSLSIAEAGIAEAISRIRAGDVPDSLNPRMVSQIFLAGAGSLPALGQDSIALATKQSAGAWLAYSTSSRGDGALTVSFKTNAARTSVYRYD